MKHIIAILMLALLSVSSVALAADYILITDNSNPESTISVRDVKNIYLGRKTVWSDGSHITVFTQTGAAVTALFMQEMVRKTPNQYATYWKKSPFNDTGLPPADLSSDQMVKAAVAAKPGAIGYISASALDDTVKQLEIK